MKYQFKKPFVILAIALAASAGARAQTCEVKVSAESATSMTAARLTGVSARATNQRTKKTYPSVLFGEFRSFGRIPAGNYKLFVSKAGYKTTIRPTDLSCLNGEVTYNVRMWEGNSRQFVTDAAKEMRLDRITVLGSSDSDTGARVVQPGEPYPSGTYKGPLPKTVSGGVLNGKAISLPKPAYPPAAQAVKAGGSVSVQVLINENGEVIAASAVSGHPLLRAAAESAARGARFSPTLLEGTPVKVSGVITYNFVP